jgi:hypothetical protein
MQGLYIRIRQSLIEMSESRDEENLGCGQADPVPCRGFGC